MFLKNVGKSIQLYLCFIIIFFHLKENCLADEILGCGGFINSHANIDYSQIKVKLFTKSGSLKDQTECAPNTGYYFLPIYDKGEYILKVEPPTGWSFEPTQVELHVDGSYTDLCSQGKDINFVFKGFGITGRVVIAYPMPNSPGPKDISISLYDQNNKTLIDSTSTSEGGVFSFTPVQPGKYVVVASHPVWVMEKHSTKVTVQEGNTRIKDGDLSVFGFDVSGKVTTTENDPVSKVAFLLFGNGKVKNCLTTPVEGFDSKKPPLCHALSDELGKFTFPALAPGNYVLIPFYAGSRTKFDVKPSELTFTVAYDSIILPQNFKVTGFTVSGNVMASLKPLIPLIGAKVFLSKKQIAITDGNGAYKSDNVKAKQYILTVEYDNVIFDEIPVKVSPNNPELPTITPSAFKVTGKVSSSTKSFLVDRKIVIKNLNTRSEQEITINSELGEWNLFLNPGKYDVSVVVSEEEKAKGLQFFPLQKIIDISFEPVKNVNFLQLKATLKGTIICLKDNDSTGYCKQTQVTLKMTDGVMESRIVNAKDGEYIFKDILPGNYEILVDTDNFCWDTSSQHISVASENPPKVPPFKQTGFSVTFVSSHDTIIDCSFLGKSGKKQSFQLLRGSTRHCVPEAGKYEFHPRGCHRYQKESYVWNSNDRTPIILSSTEHYHIGHIISNAPVDGMKVRIEGESEGHKPLIIDLLKPTKDGGLYKYEFSFYAVSGETYSIHPLSDTLLFEPSSLKITGSDDCDSNAASFSGQQGKVISGSVTPALEGVTIQIFGRDKEVPIHSILTQADGLFRVGPLDAKVSYSVNAEKEGFVLSRDPEAKDYAFYARKLAEIRVEILDTEGGTPLQGVLISLSGGNGMNGYRKNSMTGENGKLSFHSLSPGEYYLRPTMKEYRFDPASRMIRVEEGATVSVNLVGRRVAFSAHGVVTCLNGQPEPNLVIEARGQGNCSDLQEEAISKEDGTWRIRGLEPRCMYAIRLKIDEKGANSRVVRAIPSSIAVVASQDIYNLKLIAVQSISRSDVSVKVISNNIDYYRTLKVKLCREDMADAPIHVEKLDGQHSTKVGNSGFLLHFPPLQADGKKYFVQLESSLSTTSHDYKITPIYFEANTSFKYIELEFNAERKQDQAETIQMSYVPLPLIILVTLAFLNRESLSAWLNSSIENWSRKSMNNTRNTQVNSPMIANDPRMDDIIVEQIESINRKNKKVKPRKA